MKRLYDILFILIPITIPIGIDINGNMIPQHLHLQLFHWHSAIIINIQLLEKVHNLLRRNRRIDNTNKLIKILKHQLRTIIKSHLLNQLP